MMIKKVHLNDLISTVPLPTKKTHQNCTKQSKYGMPFLQENQTSLSHDFVGRIFN